MVHTHRGSLDPAAVREVQVLATAAEQHDAVEAIGEQSLLNLTPSDTLEPSADVVHVTTRDDAGRLVGYAQLDLATATAELVVDPPARRRGLGSALLGAVREEAARVGVGAPHVWAHGDLPAARALASRAEMSVVRELWKMSLDLTTHAAGAPDGGTHRAMAVDRATTPPSGVRVRPFVVGADEEAWLRVNARAFADHPEQGRITLEDLRARQGEPWFDAADFLLAESDDRSEPALLAYAWMKIERGPGETGSDEGELYVLGVDPDAQGRGLGRLLTAMALDHLAARGLRRAVLYTEATNDAAVRTYTSAGFTVARSDVQYR